MPTVSFTIPEDVPVTITFTQAEVKDLRDLLALNRGDIRRNLGALRSQLDAVVGTAHAQSVAKRWRIKTVLRDNGTVKYAKIEARRGNIG